MSYVTQTVVCVCVSCRTGGTQRRLLTTTGRGTSLYMTGCTAMSTRNAIWCVSRLVVGLNYTHWRQCNTKVWRWRRCNTGCA